MRGHRIAPKLDEQFRNACLLFEREVGHSWNAGHDIPDLGPLRLENIEIRPKDLHDNRSGRSCQSFFNTLGDELHDVERESGDALQMPADVVDDVVTQAR